MIQAKCWKAMKTMKSWKKMLLEPNELLCIAFYSFCSLQICLFFLRRCPWIYLPSNFWGKKERCIWSSSLHKTLGGQQNHEAYMFTSRLETLPLVSTISTVFYKKNKFLGIPILERACSTKLQKLVMKSENTRFLFYKEPSSRISSKSSLFLGLFLSNSSTKSSLIVP